MATAKTQTLTALEITTEGVFERELTAEELAQREIDQANAAIEAAAQEAKAAARQSALAKLAELGLTEEEIAAL